MHAFMFFFPSASFKFQISSVTLETHACALNGIVRGTWRGDFICKSCHSVAYYHMRLNNAAENAHTNLQRKGAIDANQLYPPLYVKN